MTESSVLLLILAVALLAAGGILGCFCDRNDGCLFSTRWNSFQYFLMKYRESSNALAGVLGSAGTSLILFQFTEFRIVQLLSAGIIFITIIGLLCGLVMCVVKACEFLSELPEHLRDFRQWRARFKRELSRGGWRNYDCADSLTSKALVCGVILIWIITYAGFAGSAWDLTLS